MEQAQSISFEEYGRDQTDGQLRQTIAGLRRLPVGKDSLGDEIGVKPLESQLSALSSAIVALERELEQREEERWQEQSEVG